MRRILLSDLIKLIGLFVALIFLFPRDAHAYLDPGSASLIFQIILGGLITCLVFCKSIFRKIKKILKKEKEK